MESQERKEKIKRAIAKLSAKDLRDVYAYIGDRLRIFACSGARYADAGRYISVMNDIVGEDIEGPSRRRRVAWGRFIVLGQLLEDGCTTSTAGQALGRGHNEAVYARRKVDEMLCAPGQYRYEIGLYKEFKRRIEK